MQRPVSSKSAAIILAVVLLLPVVYVLSVGPAVWMFEHDLIGEQPGRALYFPIEWAMSQSAAIDAAILWYLRLWGVEINR